MAYRTQRNLGLIFCPTQYPMTHYIFVSLKFAKKTRTNMRDKAELRIKVTALYRK